MKQIMSNIIIINICYFSKGKMFFFIVDNIIEILMRW